MSLSEQQGRSACQRIMKHTPGPWIVADENNFGADISIGETTCGVNRADHNTGVYVIERDEMMANAKLIACAPEMLEALIEFCERVERGEVRSTYTYNKFKSIIDKATR